MQSIPVAVSLDNAVASIGLQLPITRLTVTGITYDNRQVRSGFVFAALPGFKRHGIEFAADAVAAGAVAVLTDADGAHRFESASVPVIVSADPRADLALLARFIYGDAQAQLVSVGITGTNGKTTTSFLVESALTATLGGTLLIGTTGIRFGEWRGTSARTTPESSDVHQLLHDAHEAGARALVMEVSSHALVLGRVDGIVYDVAVFTGLSPDHLDFHADMEDYFRAKAQLFTSQRAERAVICVDTQWGKRLAAECSLPLLTFGLSADADWTARDIVVEGDGHMSFTAIGPHAELPVRLGLPGEFNVLNALATVAVADSLSLSLETATARLAEVFVPGRLERVIHSQDFLVLVDYAHTPDAVERALAVARTCTSGKVIAVLGCGGDRDPHKREPMGAAAASLADIVVITDDNPRTENPEQIRSQILEGARKVASAARIEEMGSRSEAIEYALSVASVGDCVIILGKGHETGQEVNGVVSPFDDREVARAALDRLSS